MQDHDGHVKPTLDITRPLDQLVDLSEKYLSGDTSIYQRAGELLHIQHDKDRKVVLKALKSPFMRYLLSRVALWVKEDESVHPPASIARCLVDRSVWPNIRKLRALTTFPPISSDGGVNAEIGYHDATNVYFAGGVEVKIPPSPSLKDAKEAVATLLDIVVDFPFATPGHASAWLAGLLSPIVRFAHNGNTPIVIVQANGPRVGKTNLVKIVAHILSGDECPVVTHTKSEDEERKRILSYLRVGRSMVLVDNVVGQYGGASVNALATSRMWEDRVLGHSKVIQVQNDTTWFITGNNIILAPDTAERCLNVRLLSLEERPHLRSGFKYPDLFSTIRERRGVLLSAALCIIKGYIQAGSPDMKLDRWGSFEPWSNLVRNALVWAGQPDPASTRVELEMDADVGRHDASSLVEGWLELEKEFDIQGGMTAKQAYDLLSNGAKAPTLRAVLAEITGEERRLPNAHTIGRHLRELRDRNFNGRAIKCHADDKKGHRWYVASMETRGQGDRGQDSPALNARKKGKRPNYSSTLNGHLNGSKPPQSVQPDSSNGGNA